MFVYQNALHFIQRPWKLCLSLLAKVSLEVYLPFDPSHGRLLVGWFVGRLVGWSVGWLVGLS